MCMSPLDFNETMTTDSVAIERIPAKNMPTENLVAQSGFLTHIL